VSIFKGLNQSQKSAVSYQKGPLLILAGAGSGKTRVLTHRLAFLLAKGVKPGRILAVTFTNKAAEEMKSRVTALTSSISGSQPPVFNYLGTFHSVAVKILRQELNQTSLPWSASFGIFDQDDSEHLIKEIVKEKKLSDDQFSAPKLKALISQAKQERLGPDQLSSDEFWEDGLKKVYREYQQRLAEGNLLDFDDLLLVLLQLLERYPKIRRKYQDRFQYILVDEYQDTNLIQYQMVKLLVNQDQNLMAVGDDWQSIYGFRGADFRNILNFKRDYPRARIIKLEQNYRSSKNILRVAQGLIEHNRQRSDKKIWSARQKGEKVSLFEAKSGEEEALMAASQIQKLANYSETVVLYRTHAQSRLIEEALLNRQIPYQIIGGVRFYQRKEIKDLVAYLWLIERVDSIHLVRAINTPRRGIGAKTIKLLARDNWDLEGSSQPRIKDFLKLIRRLRKEATKKPVDQLIEWLLAELSFKEYLAGFAVSEEEAESRWENVQELIAMAGRYRDLTPKRSLRAFLEEITLMDFQDEFDPNKERATLMTVHNVKGLEFDNVFIVGLEEGLFPHQRSLESVAELEEERRLCYVGMTRARDRLYLSWARNRAIFGRLQTQERSRFLAEIPEEGLKDFGPEVIEPKPISGHSDIGLKRGEMVQHLQLGSGRVVAVEDEMVEIEFPKLGRKKFALEYAPLKKISS